MSIIIDFIIGIVLLILTGKALVETAYGLWLICLGLLMTSLSKFFGALAWISRRLDKRGI